MMPQDKLRQTKTFKKSTHLIVTILFVMTHIWLVPGYAHLSLATVSGRGSTGIEFKKQL